MVLVLALAVGAVAQTIVNREAAVLGLSLLELTLLGTSIGAVVTRQLRA